jgi:hypothetical protein
MGARLLMQINRRHCGPAVTARGTSTPGADVDAGL